MRYLLPLVLLAGLLACNTPSASVSSPSAPTPPAPSTSPAPATAPTDPYAVPTFSFLDAEQNAFVRKELDRLTLKQKIGQMTQLSMDMFFEGDLYVLTKPYKWSEAKLKAHFDEFEIGSVLNHPSGTYPTPQQWQELMTVLQDRAKATSGVPILYGIDAIHGPNYVAGATLYAQPLGVAASFNVGLTRQLAAATAYELKASSIPWNFSPAMDVGRNPVWPRTWESFGEDVFMNAEMGSAMIAGYQGDDVTGKNQVTACLKHFTGYGSPRSGRDRTPAYIPERQLREYYFPQYQRAINEGALSAMINSGEINGVPVHASKWLLTDVLRGEMGFEGLLVSDWEDVHFLWNRHKVAPTLKDAVRMSVEAGMDMSMTPVTLDFPKLLLELVEEGTISEERIDLSVARILAVKVKMGLYEKNVWNPADYPKFGGEEFAALARQSAEEAIVLLKNDGLQLPLGSGANVLVTGPTANTMRSLNGGWTYSWQGTESDKYLADYNTIQEALKAKSFNRVNYVEGIDYEGTTVGAGVTAADLAGADVIVACMGELSYTEIEGNINDLNLPAGQYAFFERLAATGKPIVLVMAGGRPRIITSMVEKAGSVLYLPYPGPHGGDALAGILTGEVNPSGRLPLTYPRSANALLTYDYKNAETVKNGYRPLFPYGHGLSYSTIEYSPITLSGTSLGEGGTVTASVTVRNTSDRAATHSVLLFSRDEYATITPSARRLRAFDKVELAAGASQTVTFTITPEMLSYIGLDQEPVTEAGAFTLMIGDQTAQLNYVASR